MHGIVRTPLFLFAQRPRSKNFPVVLIVGGLLYTTLSSLFLLRSRTQVSKFKGLVIGGGGLLEAKHSPLDCEAFVNGIRDDLPVAIFGVGAK